MHALHTAYFAEEESFKKQVSAIARSELPPRANLIRSHVIYKIKVIGDGMLKRSARIAPHGNEVSLKEFTCTDCASCASTGVRLLLSVCVIHKWVLAKVDAKTAFLQSGSTQRAVYVFPLYESDDQRQSVRLLMTAK